jgi:hypothetical protein
MKWRIINFLVWNTVASIMLIGTFYGCLAVRDGINILRAEKEIKKVSHGGKKRKVTEISGKQYILDDKFYVTEKYANVNQLK